MLWIPRSLLSNIIDITEDGVVIVQVFEIVYTIENTAPVRWILVGEVMTRGRTRSTQNIVIQLNAKPSRHLEAESKRKLSL